MPDRLKQIVADILNIDSNLINNNTSPTNLNEWDSLNQIKIMLAIEEQYDIEFDEDDLSKFTDFKSIKELIEKKSKI